MGTLGRALKSAFDNATFRALFFILTFEYLFFGAYQRHMQMLHGLDVDKVSHHDILRRSL